QLDRVGRVLPSSQRAREDPLILTHLLEVVLLEPLPRFVPVPFLAPAPEHAEDPMIHLREGAVARGMTMVHGPAFDLLIEAQDQVARRHAPRAVNRFPDLGQERTDALPRWLDQHLAIGVASYRLAQEVEPVFAMR